MNLLRRSFVRDCASTLAAAALRSPVPTVFGAGPFAVTRASTNGSPFRRHFPACDAADRGAVYLDSAATTHRPAPVLDALTRFYVEDNANPARVHARARRAAEALSDARTTVARFINASDPLEVVFTRGTTEAVNLVAHSWAAEHVRTGDQILLTQAEHASNLLPWTMAARQSGAEVRVVPVSETGVLRVEDVARLLTSRTRLVAVAHASNVLGIINPVKEIAAVAKGAGASIFVDGAQGAPHVRVDVQDIGCDFYAFSGHKMCGPMGSGVLWVRREVLDGMRPFHFGSNMAHHVAFDRAPEYEPGALRFQAGTPDVAAPVGLAAAIRFLDGFDGNAIWEHDRLLVDRARARLAPIRGLRLIGSFAEPRIPVFSFVMNGWTAGDLAVMLDKRGIAVRAGDLAALPLLQRFGVTEAVRASAYVYSTPDEIDTLADALSAMSTRGR